MSASSRFKKVRYTLLLSGVVSLLSLLAAGCGGGRDAGPLRFLALTDTHIETGEDLARFRDFLYTVRGRDVEFVVTLGDMTGHQPEYLPGLKLIAEQADLPVYMLPGNHDDNYAHNTVWWTSVFGTPYYRFTHEGYHFLMNWSQDRDAPLPWLAAVLDSIPEGEPIVFAQHFAPSFAGEPDEGVWPLLAGRSDDIAVALSGHTHTRGTDTVGVVLCETLAACSMNASRDGYFYEITLDGTEVVGIEEFKFADLPLETPENAPPVVTVDNDSAYYVVDPAVVVRGTAKDDGAVEEIRWRLDGGDWNSIDSDGPFSLELAAGDLGPGNHLLWLAARDNQGLGSLEFTTVALYAPAAVQGKNTMVLTQGVDGYSGCTDVTVRRHEPKANCDGGELDCWVYGPEGSREFSEIYIRYDVGNARPDRSARLRGARLELFCCRQNKLSYGEGDDMYRVGVVGEAWDEGITFNARPTVPGWLPADNLTPDIGASEWPVTADVQKIRPPVKVTVELEGLIEEIERWIDRPGENHGMVISPILANYNISFCSSEHRISSLRPRLILEFE